MSRTIKHAIKRTGAVQLINRFRQELGEAKDKIANAESRDEQDKATKEAFRLLEQVLTDYGLDVAEKCNGEAHSNAHIDHCGVCMHTPFIWRWTGKHFKIT